MHHMIIRRTIFIHTTRLYVLIKRTDVNNKKRSLKRKKRDARKGGDYKYIRSSQSVSQYIRHVGKQLSDSSYSTVRTRHIYTFINLQVERRETRVGTAVSQRKERKELQTAFTTQ